MTLSLANLTAADFEPRLGEMFRIETDSRALDLRLAEVRRLGPARRTGGGFTLMFVMAEGPHLPQSIYPLANLSMGALEIFLVPIGPVDGGRGYEAVFT